VGLGLGLGGSGGGVGGWSVGGIASCQLLFLFLFERCVIERDSRSFLLFSFNLLGFLGGVLSVSPVLCYTIRERQSSVKGRKG